MFIHIPTNVQQNTYVQYGTNSTVQKWECLNRQTKAPSDLRTVQNYCKNRVLHFDSHKYWMIWQQRLHCWEHSDTVATAKMHYLTSVDAFHRTSHVLTVATPSQARMSAGAQRATACYQVPDVKGSLKTRSVLRGPMQCYILPLIYLWAHILLLSSYVLPVKNSARVVIRNMSLRCWMQPFYLNLHQLEFT